MTAAIFSQSVMLFYFLSEILVVPVGAAARAEKALGLYPCEFLSKNRGSFDRPRISDAEGEKQRFMPNRNF